MPLQRLLLKDPDAKVADVMAEEVVTFHAEDDATDAANAFERYDLVSAPVIDGRNRLMGRLTVNAVVDHIRQESDSDLLSIAGLREEEDIFASVWKSVQNRWAWLAINLVTAFIASRVIGEFEGTIEKLVALAALMPIIAGIGGNSGNQTLTMIVRALALGQIHPDNAQKTVQQGNRRRCHQRRDLGQRRRHFRLSAL
jgi:Mg/Co/Ni transporter MgtE (contains CBS domain)